MAAHKTNGLLKFVAIPVAILLLVIMVLSMMHTGKKVLPGNATAKTKNSASQDSAAESLDTLTAQLAATQQQVNTVVKSNETLQQQNQQLLSQLQNKKDKTASNLSEQMAELKDKVQKLNQSDADNLPVNADAPQPINNIPELTDTLGDPKARAKRAQAAATAAAAAAAERNKKPKPIPFYTIPANATSVEDRLMTPLIGRIPVKGVVTDPYPFKIVIADDTLAANGWRVPHLKQMIVSGYSEGDLNLVSTRGWVTSLTFVFTDGTISTTSSNDNNIGKFSKDDALGYLSDERGNPAIRGHLITNAPTYLGTSVLLGAAQGAATAYAQSQTTSSSTTIGTNTSSVTGSPSAFVAGQAMSNAAGQVQQWWHDREENSFDAVFVPTVQTDGSPQMIVVNFSKEIQIDYDPQGRKVVYARSSHSFITPNLD